MKQKNTKPEVVTGLVDSNGIPWTAPMSEQHPEPAWMREHKADVAPAQSGQQRLYAVLYAGDVASGTEDTWQIWDTRPDKDDIRVYECHPIVNPLPYSAAPELLEACKAIVDYWDNGVELRRNKILEDICHLANIARAAIAKAEGRKL